jgi:hypothetical protein
MRLAAARPIAVEDILPLISDPSSLLRRSLARAKLLLGPSCCTKLRSGLVRRVPFCPLESYFNQSIRCVARLVSLEPHTERAAFWIEGLRMRILLVEDDRLIGAAIEQALKDAAYAVDRVTKARRPSTR